MKSALKIMLSFILLIVFSAPFAQMSTEASGKFKDVPSDHWAINEIKQLNSKGIINGFPDGTFKPSQNVTKAQAAIMVAKAMNINLKNRPNPHYSDIGASHTAYKAIAALADDGIYLPSKNFYPNQALTREEMARILATAYYLEGTGNSSFKDVPKSYWAYKYVDALAYHHITSGYPDGTFKLKTPVTRAQFSVFVSKTMGIEGNTGPEVPNQEKVRIPDPNLERVIREALRKPTGTITKEDMSKLIWLDGSDEEITDLTGLEFATSLTDLELVRNQISNINALKNLKNLSELDLAVNNITDISALEGLTNLTELDLLNNQISDIRALKNLTNLTTLDLSVNQISDISALGNMIDLTNLDITNNEISNINVLGRLPNLDILYLSANQISDITELRNLTNLTELDLFNNQVSDVSPLMSLTNLTRLTLLQNQITDISALENLINLTSLDVSKNKVSDISAIKNLTNLTDIGLYDNQISDISTLRDWKNSVEYLNLMGNPLTQDALEVIKLLKKKGMTVDYPSELDVVVKEDKPITAFQMTYEQVKSKEIRKLILDNPAIPYLEYDAQKYGLSSRLGYHFHAGQLESAVYEFNVNSKDYTNNQLETLYRDLQDTAIEEFGESYRTEEEINKEYVYLRTSWIAHDEHDAVLLVTNKKEPYKENSISISLTYYSPWALAPESSPLPYYPSIY
ncbi:leucine-rich repeat domain-containing protein [Bacillus sp. FJAT-27231]|uniref:leucine-rich repeat domain-containing protein n=1 Tax=Bacillus sp. FJAT-27231 TaxID=1679168 RepID=UPI00069FADE4|nr:leucine-rich repeat domain-containing protein [Bacillus sp. FJAT-27231]